MLRRHSHALPDDSNSGRWWKCLLCCSKSTSSRSAPDFLSVGSNDLVQYLYAADRDNNRVAKRYDTLSAPILRALKTIVDAADRAKKPVTLCGEMGGRTLEALALLALGYRSLSMAPASIGPVKAMVMELDLGGARMFLDTLIAGDDGRPSIRENLRQFAQAHGVPL